jgi:hypothetical protein
VGSGPARELDGGEEEIPLPPELATRLTAALDKLDRAEAAYKEARKEEKYSQTVKAWGRTCVEIDGHLRAVAKAVLKSHQLNLDTGSDGGGQNTKPWIEELTGKAKIERLTFKLDGDGDVVAFTPTRTLAKEPTSKISYDWLSNVIVNWIVTCAEAKR